MATRKKTIKKSVQKIRPPKLVSVAAPRSVRVVNMPRPVTDVVTEKTYITTEPEIEIRRAATLAQALTEPRVAVVKPKMKVHRVRQKTRRVA